jgi:PAS domain S-box-containing protein
VIIVASIINGRLINAGRANLQNKAELVQQLINNNFQNSVITEIQSFKAFIESSNYVSAGEFHNFYYSGNFEKNTPFLYGISFARYIKQDQKADLIKEIRSQNHFGAANFKIFPETKNEFIAPIVYAEPKSIVSGAIGFDGLSEPIRAAAINKAINSDAFILSDKLSVVPSNSIGFIGYLPVYNKNVSASSTPAEKKENIYGFIGTAFEAQGMFNGFRKGMSEFDLKNLDIEVYDGKNVNNASLIYDFDDSNGRNVSIDSSLAVNLPLDLGGHDFTLTVASPEGLLSFQDKILLYSILIGGGVLSLLILAFLYALSNSYFIALDLAKDMTKELKDAKRYYQALFYSSKEAMVILTPDGQFTTANSVAVKLFGCSTEKDFISRSPWDYCPERQPDGSLSAEKVQKHALLAMEKGEESFDILTKKNDTGEEFWSNINMSAITSGDKKLILVTVRDITEKKKYDEYIKETNFSLEKSQLAMTNVLEDIEKEKKEIELLAQDLNKFKLAVDNVSDHIIITDPDGVVLYANNAVSVITGYSNDEIIGKRPSLWGNQMPKEFYVKFWKIIKEDKKVFIGEINNKRKNGEIYIAEIKVAPILDKNGNVVFFVGVERDITRIKEVDKAKSEFVSVTSHQLRTPLTAVKWLVEILLRNKDKNLNDKQINALTEIYKSNERTLAIINDLLTLSRIESGKTSGVTLVEVDAADFIKTTIKALEPLAKNRKIDLQLKIDLPAGYKIMLDKEKIIQSINNLVSNAIKYSKPEGGVVLVTVESKNGEFIFSVKDNGIGIPLAAQHRIFERFFRADNAVLSQTEGTGLGLPIVKEYITAHNGGKVWFESKEGVGTTFYFSLPEKSDIINNKKINIF